MGFVLLKMIISIGLARFLGLSEDVKNINSLWILPVSEIHCSGYDNLNKIKFEESDNKK